MTISKEVRELNDRIAAYVTAEYPSIIPIAVYEEALVMMYEELFKETLGESYDTLMDSIEAEIDKITPFPASLLDSFRRSGNGIPINKDVNAQKMLAIANNEAMTKWITGELNISHMLIAMINIVAMNNPFYMFFRSNTDKAESLIKYFMKNESEEYGIPLNMPENGNTFVTDLIEKAKDFKKPFVGREDIIERVVQSLCRMDKCNPVCVGEPGVGKTAIVYGLARRIREGNVPKQLKNAELYSVDLAGMLAGTKFRGEFEQRLKDMIAEMEKKENVILFFDEIHTLVGAGACGDSSMDAANIIKPILAEGKIRFIGATTYDEYGKHIEKDKALARRFQKIEVNEPSIEDSIEILMGLKEAYENFHHVKYSKGAIKAAVNLSAKYMLDRFLPDKAIDVIDETGAYYSIHEMKGEITEANIEEVMVKICKINQVKEDKDNLKTVINLEKRLNAQVFGQSEATAVLSKAIQMAKAGLSNTDKPLGSFLFVGPSGVGKTEVAKQLSNILNMNLIRLDMSEYSEANTVSKLFGTSAGYIGYDDGGILTNAVMKNPNSVILFDEIEKAHPEIFKTLLQIMDYGRMTDNKGRKVDFRNCILIMTSNAGATVANKKLIGIAAKEDTRNVDGIMDAVNQTFAPEFRGRLTKIVVFNGITADICKMIVRKELKIVNERLKPKKIFPEYTDACIDELIRLGVSPSYGAREVQHVIDDKITTLFVDYILGGKELGKCSVDFKNGKFKVNKPSVSEKIFNLAESVAR